jgi:hypothetical protein
MTAIEHVDVAGYAAPHSGRAGGDRCGGGGVEKYA